MGALLANAAMATDTAGMPAAQAPLDIAEWSFFWVGVERVELARGAVVNGKQMYVEYQIPAQVKHPYPIVLVIAGLALGFVPGMPRVTLHPDIVFLVVLPPLLYSAAWQTSWREFRYNIVSIGLLAFGLVGFLVASVALVAPRLLPGFDWRMGFAIPMMIGTIVAASSGAVAMLFSPETKGTQLVSDIPLV